MEQATLEKIFEYASMPVHGTLSRKIRKDVKIQINEGKVYESAVLFLGDGFIRITEQKEPFISNFTNKKLAKIITIKATLCW